MSSERAIPIRCLPADESNFVWDLALSKLYTNCLLSTLNARQRLAKVSATSGSVQQRNNSHGPMISPTPPMGRRNVRRNYYFVPRRSFVRLQPDHSVRPCGDNVSGADAGTIQRRIGSSAVYELDTQKPTYDVETAYGVPPRDEYGIQVTKVCADLRVRSARFDFLTAARRSSSAWRTLSRSRTRSSGLNLPILFWEPVAVIP